MVVIQEPVKIVLGEYLGHPAVVCVVLSLLLAASWYRTDTMAPAVAGGGGSSDPSQLIRRGHCSTAGVMPQLTSDPLQLV